MTNSPDETIKTHGTVREFPAQPPRGAATGLTSISVLSSADFVKGYLPPDYVIDGVIQRGFIYSLCGATGSGKTAIALRLLASTALGRQIGARGVAQGRAIMLVGENPDDVRARWIGLAEHMGFDTDDIDVQFVPGIFPVTSIGQAIHDLARTGKNLSLIVVDTGAAYFDGEDENDNKQHGDYARRLRTLTALPDRPCVIVNCHPVKNAASDNLLPRGGGAFLNEVDGNLTCKLTDRMVELHWQGKFRGPDFQPIPFEIQTVTSRLLVDSRGRPVPTVISRALTDNEQAALEKAADKDLHMLVAAMAADPGASVSALATALGWTTSTGEPMKSKAHRALKALQAQKLAEQKLKTWQLTPMGEKTAKRLSAEPAAG